MSERVKKVIIAIMVLLVGIGLATGIYVFMSNNDGLDIDSNAKKYEANIQKPGIGETIELRYQDMGTFRWRRIQIISM